MSDSTHATNDSIGDRYVVLGFIGEGGMQQVYRARDLLLSRDVALKVPKNGSAQKRFKRSAVMSARVNHANVAKTLDYVEFDGRTYLIEELIEGKDLSLIRADALPFLDPHLVARIFHHLAKGLCASHHAGVVHRDLKPSNVMVEGGEQFMEFKITDFGIAKMAEAEIAQAGVDEKSLNASLTAMGALPYMSPEAIESLKDAGHPSDIWSLGAMTYELMCGQKPFGAGLKAAKTILDGNPPPLPPIISARAQFRTLAGEVFSLVMKCLSHDPNDRPTADELVLACEALCYTVAPMKFGSIRSFAYQGGTCGFINCDDGSDVFFHQDSLYGGGKLAIGERVLFAVQPGGGNDRAFPISRSLM